MRGVEVRRHPKKAIKNPDRPARVSTLVVINPDITNYHRLRSHQDYL